MTDYDEAFKIYSDIAKQQFNGTHPPFKTAGKVIRRAGRYGVETDDMGTIVPININIGKYIGKRVVVTFNVTTYNSYFGYPVNLIYIARERV